MDVGRRQPSTFVISRAPSACKVVSRSQLRHAEGRALTGLGPSMGSSRVPAPRWGGLLRDEPKGPSAHGLLNLKVLQFTAKIEISITLSSTNFCISHLKGKNIQYLTFPYTKYKNLRYFRITYFFNCYFERCMTWWRTLLQYVKGQEKGEIKYPLLSFICDIHWSLLASNNESSYHFFFLKLVKFPKARSIDCWFRNQIKWNEVYNWPTLAFITS